MLGDITEESRRRSRLWYWSQLLAVLLVGSWRDVRRHKGLAFRATVTGILTFPVFYLPAVVAMLFVSAVLAILSLPAFVVGGAVLGLKRDLRR